MTIRDETEAREAAETIGQLLRLDAERMAALQELARTACAAPLGEECATW